MFKHCHDVLPARNNKFIVLSASEMYTHYFLSAASLIENAESGVARLSPVCARTSLRLGLRMSQLSKADVYFSAGHISC